MFSWLWDRLQTKDGFVEGVGELITEEFDMYRHHQAEINGVPNKDWLSTMYHSLTKQIIRQDLEYWLGCVCLRPDRDAKHAIPGDFLKVGISRDFELVDGNTLRFGTSP